MKLISKILLLLCLNALAIEISGKGILLDLGTSTPDWLTYDCHYSLDYIDNWAFGCGKTEPEQDIYPAYKGFWTQCKPVACHFLIDAEYLRISNMTIKSYFHGESQIIVSGKETINATDSIEIITFSDGRKIWFEQIVPVADHLEAKILNITLTAPELDGYILVDNIFLEYEDIPRDPTLLLDLATSTPEWLTYDCHYSLDYIDNWAFGCGKTEPEQDIYPAYKGFWTQCKPVACHFLIDGEYLRISNMTIKSYFHGESQIIVSGKETINSTDSTEIITISNGGKTWSDQIIPVADHPKAKIFNITLTAPEVDGYILVDNIFFAYEHLPGGFVCPTESGNFQDVEDCRFYYACDDWVVVGHIQCPGDLLFNPVISNCDFPWNVDCDI